MIICPQCSASNSISAIGPGEKSLCRMCGQELLPKALTDSSFTQELLAHSNDNPSSKLNLTELINTFTGEKKFRLNCEIGRGGMGAIYSVYENSIHRDVAMKVMLHESGTGDLARFIQEAQITGQLEHPNIVPVHELGFNSEGQPYFTMKKVDGRSLATLLSAIKCGNTEDITKYTLPRLLTFLVNVCNAIAFAHSKGIVHRDLKPGNIMLGNFGEVLVMDWGVAKSIADRSTREDNFTTSTARNDVETDATADAALSSIIWSFRNESGTHTIPGTITGTPAYMSPEQAQGNIANIDERSDVYSLGAILYEILTLSPPVRGNTLREVLHNVMEGKIEAPIDAAPSRKIPPELSAISMKALSTHKDSRYQSANELREDIERYLQGVSVSARNDSVIESIVKLIKRNRQVFITSMIASMVIVAVLAISFQKILEKKNDAETQLGKRLEMEKKEQLRLDGLRREAEDAQSRGKTALQSSKSTIQPGIREKWLIDAQSWYRRSLFLIAGNTDAESGMRQASIEHFALALDNNNWRQGAEKLEQAHQYGLSDKEYEFRKKQLADAESERGRKISERVTALMKDAAQVKRTVPHDMASSELISLRDPLTVTLLEGYVKDANPDCRVLAIDSLAWMDDPRSANIIQSNIGKIFNNSPNHEYVQEAAVRAICILSPLDEEIYSVIRNRMIADKWHNESLFYRKLERYYIRYSALMANQPLISEYSDGKLSSAQWLNRGIRCQDSKQYEAAAKCFDKVLELDPSCHDAYFYRGGIKAANGDLKGAVADFDEAIKLIPENVNSYWNRGKFKSKAGNLNGALIDFDMALRIKPKHAFILSERAEVKRKKGDLSGAVADYTEALEADPKNIGALDRRGWALREVGELNKASLDFESVAQLNTKSAQAFFALGTIKHEMGNLSEALSNFQSALSIDPQLTAAYSCKGELELQQGKLDQAINDFNKALTLDPRHIWAYVGRARVQLHRGDLGNAITDVETALSIDHRSPDALVARAEIEIISGNLKTATEYCENALTSNGRFAPAYLAMISIKEKLQDWSGLVAICRRWTNASPKNARAFHTFAQKLLYCKSPDHRNLQEALAYARKATELSDKKLPEILETLADALYENGEVTSATETLEVAMSLLHDESARTTYVEKLSQFQAALKLRTGK